MRLLLSSPPAVCYSGPFPIDSATPPRAKMFAKFAAFTLASALLAYSGVSSAVLQKRTAEYFDPAQGGGSMLIDTNNGLGEPLNVSPVWPPLTPKIDQALVIHCVLLARFTGHHLRPQLFRGAD